MLILYTSPTTRFAFGIENGADVVNLSLMTFSSIVVFDFNKIPLTFTSTDLQLTPKSPVEAVRSRTIGEQLLIEEAALMAVLT
jgi:hypothetical protein